VLHALTFSEIFCDAVTVICKPVDVLLGAHELIMHILEPSLQQRATLRDIATHHWLQDRPRQDSASPQPEMNCDGSLPCASIELHRSSSQENLNSILPVFNNNQYYPTALPVTVTSSFYDSLSARETDGEFISSSSSRSPNTLLPDVEVSSHSMRDKVIAGDYIPLCDDSAVGHCLRLSGGIASEEYSAVCHKSAGCTFSDRLISSPHISADFSFRPACSFRPHSYRSTSHDPLSDARYAFESDIPLSVARAASETKLPRSFSVDSLELLADGNHNTSSSDTGSDENSKCERLAADDSDVRNLADGSDGDSDDEADETSCGNYDFADIDAVLDHVISDVGRTGAEVDTSSQVSYDSLEDDV